jgi:hypothetical protein
MWNGGVLYSVGASPFTSYCSGDGSGAACPCGNGGAPGAGCANGSGSGAVLGAEGDASVSGGGPVLTGAGVPAGQPAVFFQGENAAAGGAGVPFGDGLRCAAGSLLRIETRTADGAGSVATTVSVPEAGGAQPGETRRYQLWYRDPAGSPCGSGFNTSQGLAIAWQP